MDSTLRRKHLILILGVILSFFTHMGKTIVPGSVFSELQNDLGLGADTISGFGALFMYAYAVSQFGFGIYSNRYGGIRLLVSGGGFFCLGAWVFPFVPVPWIMSLSRFAAGLGAGMVSIGLFKLVSDLYAEHFATVLGVVLFVGYLGPMTGTFPVVCLVQETSWRTALIIPAVVASVTLFGMLYLMPGTLKPVERGGTVKVLKRAFCNRNNLLVFWISGVVFGIYYPIISVMGQKSLEDCGNMSKSVAALVLGSMVMLTALNNLLTGVFLNLCRNRTKILLISGALCSLTGILSLSICFHFEIRGILPVIFLILVAFPAGFFAIFSRIIQKINPPEYTGIMVAMLNCVAFIMIAAGGNIAGYVLSGYDNLSVDGSYPAEAYAKLFAVFAVIAFSAFLASFFVSSEEATNNGKDLRRKDSHYA